MPLTAQYRTECFECGYNIQPGDQIERADDEHWQHQVCPDDVQADTAEPACTSCFLIHAGECM